MKNFPYKRFSSKTFIPRNSQDLLALDICQALDDSDNLPLYLSYVRKYSPKIIQRAFNAARELPANKIRKTRGALFTYLVKYYAEEQDIPKNHSH